MVAFQNFLSVLQSWGWGQLQWVQERVITAFEATRKPHLALEKQLGERTKQGTGKSVSEPILEK